jgi:flavin-dependent dehydrogenase
VDVVDVAVVGGGPAGAVTAHQLARAGLRVALLERTAGPVERVGENLPASARALLARLDLGNTLDLLDAVPALGLRSFWGSATPSETSALFNPYGHGWHLDRGRFDGALWRAALGAGVWAARGVELQPPRPRSDGWHLAGRLAGTPLELSARFLVDATGRGAWLSRRLGSPCHRLDDLVGLAFRFEGTRCQQATVEAFSDGWWYTAPLPGDRQVSIAMLDADDLAGRRRAGRASWQALAAGTVTAGLHGGSPVGVPRVWLARSQVASATAPTGWLPVGDAALAFDPLSSLGLSFALASAREAAAVITASLAGAGTAPLADYLAGLRAELSSYRRTHRDVYRREQRWSDRPFWRSRQGAII